MAVFFFLKTLFKKLVLKIKGRRITRIKTKKYETYATIHCIKGIRFMLRGKLKGKPRKSCVKMATGFTQGQSAQLETHYSKLHTYNRYGAYGFKA